MERQGKPAIEEVPRFYQGYMRLAEGDDVLDALRRASDRAWRTVERMPPGHDGFRYAPGKWSIKQIFQHLIDSERIFAYRALRFARNDATELPGFEEDAYALHADVDHRGFHELMEEHDRVRAATIALFGSFTPAMLARGGRANGQDIGTHALGWIIAGHAMHHMKIIHERYLHHGEA
ncbi:MAG: DinB family protein [Flavobacteriales bacterium]|nr:DinB family protein [Flavobacteriales bacterium]